MILHGFWIAWAFTVVIIIIIIIIIIIMKNFNRHSSYGDHGSKQHTHSPGSHAFTHTLTSTQLQPGGAKHQLNYYRIWNQIFILKVPNAYK